MASTSDHRVDEPNRLAEAYGQAEHDPLAEARKRRIGGELLCKVW